MNTATPDETSLSAGSLAVAALAAGGSATLVAPALVVPAYGRLVVTALLLGGALAAGRLLLATAVAARRREPPAEPAPGEWPAVSLVVTAYNEADVLPATLDACADLAYPGPLEVIVGYEAASTDGTAAVAEAAAAEREAVTAVERPAPPGGKASATNNALAAADGEVIGVLDADQRPAPDAVARAARWLAADGSTWCVKGRCLGTNPRDSPLALAVTVERNLVERTEFVARDRLGGFALFTGGQAFLRASVFERVGHYDESILLEDLDMAYRLQRAGGTVRVDPGIVTREENPATVSAWWHQRKRWARGGMQVARRYLGRDLLAGPPSAGARADLAATLGALLAIPAAVLAAPTVLVVGRSGVLPAGVADPLWAFVICAPIAAGYASLAIDARDGRHRDPVEAVGPLLLWPYAAVQSLAIVAAFLEAFALRRPARYVTSTSPES